MCLPLFRCKKISVPEFLRSARSSFLLFPIKKENRQRLYNLLSIFILKLILVLWCIMCIKYLYDKTRYWNGWNRIGEGENYI